MIIVYHNVILNSSFCDGVETKVKQSESAKREAEQMGRDAKRWVMLQNVLCRNVAK